MNFDFVKYQNYYFLINFDLVKRLMGTEFLIICLHSQNGKSYTSSALYNDSIIKYPARHSKQIRQTSTYTKAPKQYHKQT